MHLINENVQSSEQGQPPKAISNSSCIYQAGSLTGWKQANMTKPLATAPAQLNRITYFLRAGKCHKAISNSSCTYQPGSLTAWGQANATRPSATALASMTWDHLLSEGRQMSHGHQQQLLHLSVGITYSLRVGKWHKTISNSSCIYQPGSLTIWGQANATRPWARDLASMNQDHLLSDGREMPQGHQ